MGERTDDSTDRTLSRVVEATDRTLSRASEEIPLYRVFAGLLILALVVGAGSGGVTAQSDSFKRQLLNATEQDANELRDWTERNRELTLTVSNNPALAEESQRQAYVDRVFQNKAPDHLKSIHIAKVVPGEGLQIVASTNQSRLGEDAEKTTDWGRVVGATTADVATLTDPIQDASGETVIAGLSASRESLGVVAILIFDISGVSDRFSSPVNGTVTEVVRPTETGTTVLFSDSPEERELEPYIPDTQAAQITEIANATGEVKFEKDPTRRSALGEKYVAAYTAIPGTEWVLIKHAPADSSSGLPWLLLGAGVLCLLVITGGAVLLKQR